MAVKYPGLECILLIDDDDATNFIHKMIIDSANIDVHVEICDSGQKALDYLTSTGDYAANIGYPQPGIVFLDINMPGMSGWEFLEKYESLPFDQKAKVVVAMLTTSLNPDDAAKGNENENVKHFKSKPLTVQMLEDIIDENFT